MSARAHFRSKGRYECSTGIKGYSINKLLNLITIYTKLVENHLLRLTLEQAITVLLLSVLLLHLAHALLVRSLLVDHRFWVVLADDLYCVLEALLH